MDRERRHHRRGGGKSTLEVQRVAIDTFGGSFDTVQYEAVSAAASEGKQDVGAVMDLKFTPNQLVEGKVGLVQTGKALRDGKTDIGAGDLGKQARAQKAGDLDQGRFLDRSNRKENPIFGMADQKREMGDLAAAVGGEMDAGARNTLKTRNQGATVTKADPSSVAAAAEVSSRMGSIGGRTAAPAEVSDAKLRDEPARTRAWDSSKSEGEEIEIRFETAALGLSGAVEGAYMGSVEWGFKADKGKATADPIPFQMVSMGAPTEAFSRSATLWNAQATSGSGSTTRMTLPVHATTHSRDATLESMLRDPATPADQRRSAIEARIAQLQAQIPADIGTRIAALRQTAIGDQLAAAKFLNAVDALQAQYVDLGRRINLERTASHTANEELAQAVELQKAAKEKASIFARVVGSDKLKQAGAEVTAKKSAAEGTRRSLDDLQHQQDALGPQINAAKTDPAARAALATYREHLLELQNQLSAANSRSFEITALRAKLPAEARI